MNNNTNDKAFVATPWKDEGDIFEKIRKWIFISVGIASVIGWISNLLELDYLGSSGLIYDAKKTLAGRGIYLSYKGNDFTDPWKKMLVLLAVALCLAVLMNLTWRYKRILSVGLIFSLLLIQMRLGNETSSLWFLLFAGIMIIPFITTMRAYVYVMVPLGILCLIFYVATDSSSTQGWGDRWEHFRYGIEETILPEGNLNLAYHLQRTDDIALEVSDSGDRPYYLKGFVGTFYEENQWINDSQQLDDFEAGILTGNDDFLSWLHEKGYSGWNQLAQSSDNTDEQVISIQNIEANRKYIYLPYELSTQIKDLETEGIAVSSSGETLLARGIFGRKYYEFKTVTDINGAEEESTNTGESYENYEEYVRRTCLMLPKEVKESLSNITNGTSTVGMEDPLSLVLKVRSWMNSNISYKEEIERLPKDQEFLSWFFDGHSEGYDVHYASIAVMMFRYYGIPSRYVEGYLVTGNKEVTQKEAHAWPEIYISGRGWIPVEVMESYAEIMPSYLEENSMKDTTSSEEAEEQKESDQNSGEQEVDSSQEEDPEDSTVLEEMEDTQADVKEDNKSWSVLPGIITIILLIIIVPVLILYLKEYLRRKRNLNSISPERSLTMWYDYCIWLMYELENDLVEKQTMLVDNRMLTWEERWMKYHSEVSESQLHQVGLLRQKAIYRPKGIEWDEAETAIRFFEEEYDYLFKHLTFIKKWKVRLGIKPAFLRKKGR